MNKSMITIGRSITNDYIKNSSPKLMNKDQLLGLAEFIYKKSNSRYSNPSNEQVLESMHQYALTLDHDQASFLLASLVTPEGQLIYTELYNWAREGFPQVQIGHKYAAALLVTSVPKDLLAQVSPPWNCFMIQIPEGLIRINNPSLDGPESLHQIWVMKSPHSLHGEAWSYRGVTGSGLMFWRFGMNTPELANPDESWLDEDPYLIEQTDIDHKAHKLVGTLVINLCLAMTNPELVKETGAGHKYKRKTHKGSKRSPEPTVRTFQVGKPVVHDFRVTISDYNLGKSSKLTVQSRVSGHYKYQQHGDNNSLRKIIWVEPYWRGPEAAPILVRPHIIK